MKRVMRCLGIAVGSLLVALAMLIVSGMLGFNIVSLVE